MALLLSCGGQKDDRRVITVTIEPLRYFVEQLVEDKAEVVTLVPKGSSPENYEPTAQQMVALGNSMMFVKVGNLGFALLAQHRLSRQILVRFALYHDFGTEIHKLVQKPQARQKTTKPTKTTSSSKNHKDGKNHIIGLLRFFLAGMGAILAI